jgi:hypothetical protein
MSARKKGTGISGSLRKSRDKLTTLVMVVVLGVLLIIAIPVLVKLLPGETVVRIAKWLRERNVPEVFIPSTSEDVRLVVHTGQDGWGSLALAFDQVASKGKRRLIVEPPDLRDLRVCRQETVVRATEEEALVGLLLRYPRCFARPEVTDDSIRVGPTTDVRLVRTTDGRTKAIWCDCASDVIARAGHK